MKIFQWFKEWITGTRPGDPNPGAPGADVATASLAAEKVKGWRRTLFAGVGALVIGFVLASSCKPNYKKELTESQKTVEKQHTQIEAVTSSVESLKATVTAYEQHAKVRRTQKGYLDGQGQPVRDAHGNPVLLETVTTVTGSSGSTATTDLERRLATATSTITDRDITIANLKKSLEERRGGSSLSGSFGTRGSAGLDLNGSLGAIKPGVGGRRFSDGSFEIDARLGLDLGFLGL